MDGIRDWYPDSEKEERHSDVFPLAALKPHHSSSTSGQTDKKGCVLPPLALARVKTTKALACV